ITDPVNVTSEGWYDVPSVEGSGTVYRLWNGGATGSRYFLVENRRPADCMRSVRKANGWE
ncbi:MAG: hypothetical protein JXR55_06510, partial [Candidatus Fermentibacteraceae bacterium]|nr:hypothetical protein [Candidatus Fermentibacteraceae bacterium]